MTKKKIKAFVCSTTFQHELGKTSAMTYPSKKKVLELNCVGADSLDECGVYEIEITLKKIHVKGKDRDKK